MPTEIEREQYVFLSSNKGARPKSTKVLGRQTAMSQLENRYKNEVFDFV